MTNCVHDFIKVKEGNDAPTYVVCAYCGQVRKLYIDGLVEVLKMYGKVTWETKATMQTGDSSIGS